MHQQVKEIASVAEDGLSVELTSSLQFHHYG